MDNPRYSEEECCDDYIICIRMADNRRIYIRDIAELSDELAAQLNIELRPPPGPPNTALEDARLDEDVG